MKNLNHLKGFLDQTNILAFTVKHQDLWICNVYFAADENCNLYFVSRDDTKHGKQLLVSQDISFAAASHNPVDIKDKKGIQGLGVCTIVSQKDEQMRGIELLNRKFGLSRDAREYLSKNPNKHLYKISPSYIKFTNDEIYKNRSKEEIVF